MDNLPIVALMTDFGTRDWYVAAMKGVILARCPQARVVDITHEVPAQDIVAGAFTLAAAVPWFPPRTVFVGVVDPGVGSRRALVAAEANGHYFVGPDNGVLALSLARAVHRRIVRLTQRRYWLPTISRTFHGRDIMAPVAVQLACGLRLARLGTPVRDVQPLELPAVQQRGRRRIGRILHIDAFGNLITNLPAAWLRRGTVTLHYRQRRVRVVSSYVHGRPRELIAVAGSLGWVELAVFNGSAASRWGAKRGDPVELRL
jgi:S-adenosylmethionine hydrolase